MNDDRAAEVRAATLDDVGGIAVVRLSNGPAHADSGANPDYCRHLIEHEHLWVALDDGGAVVGFAGAVDTGGARLLSDLFVHADAHGRGVGSGLLGAVLEGAARRYTFATTDPAALPLYMRAGMRTRWTLLEMSGPATAFDTVSTAGLTVERANVDSATSAERELTGLDRSSAHGYWASRPGAETVVVTSATGLVGVAALARKGYGGAIRIDHVATVGVPVPAVLAAVVHAVGARSVHAYVPGSTECAAWLLAHRFVVDDISLHMATDDAEIDPALVIVHPGLG